MVAQPWLVLAAAMMVMSGIPDIRSDADFVWQAMGPNGPGYESLEILTREGAYGPPPGLVVTFRIGMDTSEGLLDCSGELQAFRGDPNYVKIVWETQACGDANGDIAIAHYALENADASSRYSSQELEATLQLLCHWVRESKIRAESIKSFDVRYLVEDRLTGGP